MLNLYEKLHLSPTASPQQIQAAMRRAAEQQSMSLEELQKCKHWLLNPDKRKQYNAQLFAAHPEILDALLSQQPEKTPQKQPESSPDTNVIKKQDRKIKIKKNLKQPKSNTAQPLPLTGKLLIGFLGLLIFSNLIKGNKSEAPSSAIISTVCSEQVKLYLNYPETYEYVYDKRQNLQKQTDGSYILTYYYTAKNAFGVPSRFSATCQSQKENVLLLDTKEAP